MPEGVVGRRGVVHALIAGAAGTVFTERGLGQTPASQNGPSFFDPRSFGAKGDGKTLDTSALNTAITACNQAGGGFVYVSPGLYLSGTIILRSNVTLYLDSGATILGSREIRDYSPQAGPEAGSDAGQNHLIFAKGAENVSIQGGGCIDGQGRSFWVSSGREVPGKDSLWKDVATYDWKPLNRPSPMLEFVNCSNLRVEGIRIQNSAGWTMRYLSCTHVFLDGLIVRNPIFAPNADGMDITNSQNVFVSNCVLNVADDVICLKSENPYGSTIPVTRNIVITNCVLSGCCNGLKIGTATRGGFENITFSNSVICNEDVILNQRMIAAIALEMVDGGWIEGVSISNIRIQRARTAIFIRRGNRTPRKDGTPGSIRGVMIDGVSAADTILTSSVTGLPGYPVEDVSLSNIRIDSDESGLSKWDGKSVPEQEDQYPEARMFGRLPAYGLYCRHVSGLRVRDMVLRATTQEQRPAAIFEDVKQLEVAGLCGTPVKGKEAFIHLIQSQDVWVRASSAPEGAKSLVEVRGERSEGIRISDCDAARADQPVVLAEDVSSKAVTVGTNLLPASFSHPTGQGI